MTIAVRVWTDFSHLAERIASSRAARSEPQAVKLAGQSAPAREPQPSGGILVQGLVDKVLAETA